MKYAALLFVLLPLLSLRAQEADAAFKDLLPQPHSVPEDRNGAALLESLVSQHPAQLNGYRFMDYGMEPDFTFSVDELEVEEFFDLHGDLISVAREILSRPRFVMEGKAPDNAMNLLFTTCKALTAKAALEAGEGNWNKAWTEFVSIHRLGCECAAAGPLTSWGMGGLGLISMVCGAARGQGGFWHDAKAARQAAKDFTPLGNLAPAFAAGTRAGFKEQFDYFKICRAGDDELKRLLIRQHLVLGALDSLIKATKEKRSPQSAAEEATDKIVNLEERIEKLMKKVPAEVAEQLKAAQATNWDAAIAGLAEWHRALLKADCSTWARLQVTLPPPDTFLKGFPLKHLEGTHAGMKLLYGKYYRVLAQSRMLKLQLALIVYHIERDALPEKLDELVPEYLAALPEDPFSGKPIRFDAKAGRLWCVGLDLADDTGKSAKSDDCVLRLPLSLF
jgi:hypothetical protein